MESQASMLYKFSRIVPEDVEVDEDIPVTFLDAFEGNRVRVGRGNPRYRKENEILCVSPSKHVSRTHCILEFRNGDWFIIDYGSSNGTFVNMLRIETSDEDKKKLHYRKLQNKDIVGLGVEGFDEDDDDRKFNFPLSEYYIFQFEKICIKNEKQRQSVRAAGLDTATGASSSEVVVDLDSLSDTTSRTSNNTRKRRESETTQAVASDVEILGEEDKLKPKKSVRFQPSKDSSSGSTSTKDGKKEASDASNRSKSKQGRSQQSKQTSKEITLNDSSQDDTDVGQVVVQKKKKKYSGNNGGKKNDSVDSRKREQNSRKSTSESDIEIVRECKSPKKKSSMKRVSERDSDSETKKKKQTISKSVSHNHKNKKSSKSESTDDDSDGVSDDRNEYKKTKPKEKGTPKISNLGRAITIVGSSENSGSESVDHRTKKNRMHNSQPKQSEKSSQKKRRSDEDSDFESDHRRKKDKVDEMQNKDKKKFRIDFDSDDQESEDSSSSSDSEADKAKRRKKSTAPFHSAAVKKASPQKKSTTRKLRSETESDASSDLNDFQTSTSKKNSNGNRKQTANSRTLDGFIVADDYVERRSRQKWPKKTNTSSSRMNGNKTSRVEASSDNDSSKLKKKAAKRGDMAKNGKVVDKNSSESEEESDEEGNIILLPSKKGKESSMSDSRSDAKKWKYRELKENSSKCRKDISNRNSSKQRQALKSTNPENMDDFYIELVIKENRKSSVQLSNHRKRQLSLEVYSGENNSGGNSKKPKSQSLKESEPVTAKQRVAHAQSRHVVIQPAATMNQNDDTISSTSSSSSEIEIPLWKLKEMEQQMRGRTPWIQLREPFEYDQDDDSYSLEWSPAMKQQLNASAMDKMEKQYLASRRRNAQVLKMNKHKKRQRPRVMEPEFFYDRGTIRVKEPIMPKQTSTSRSRPSTSGSAGASRKRRSSEVESDSSVVSSVMALSTKSENSNSSKIRRIEKPAEDEHIETLDIESDSTPQEGVDASIDFGEIDEPEDTNDPGGQSESNMEIGDDNNNANAFRTHEPRRKTQLIDALPHAPTKGRRNVEAPPRARRLSRNSQTPSLHPQSLTPAQKKRLKEIAENDKKNKPLQNVEKEAQQHAKPKVRLTQNTRQDNLVKDMQKSIAGTH